MNILGIVAEYNPFHNGHLYQLEEAKKQIQPDYTVAMMSGNFLQRGEPALFDKYTRTKMALAGGVDAIYELPVMYALSSADEFAKAAVIALSKLSVTHLAFGAECLDLTLLDKIADILLEEPPAFKELLSSSLKNGLSYAKACANAISALMPDQNTEQIVNQPNNTLAIGYLKAIKSYCPDMQPVLIPRKHAGYHDTSITGNICSATAIRNTIYADATTFARNTLTNVVPATTFDLFPTLSSGDIAYLQMNDFSLCFHYAMLHNTKDSLCEIHDISEDLTNRLLEQTPLYCEFLDFIESSTSKQYTTTRVSRICMHILLNMKQQLFKESKEHGYIFYVRLLGFRQEASALIKHQKANCPLAFIQKTSEWSQIINQCLEDKQIELATALFHLDLKASQLYAMIWKEKHQQMLPSDYETNAILY